MCICNLVTLTAGHQIRKKKKKNVRILTKNIHKSLFHLIETVGNSPRFCISSETVVVAINGFFIPS